MEKILFRPATEKDAAQLAGLRALMQCEVNGVEAKTVTPQYRKDLVIYFREALLKNEIYCAVAEIEGKLIAANGLVLYRKPPSMNGKVGLNGYVSNVYTLPEYRGRGIAQKLMQLLVDYARESGARLLHLGATSAGKAVYERVGFKDPEYVPLELRF